MTTLRKGGGIALQQWWWLTPPFPSFIAQISRLLIIKLYEK